MNSPLCQALGKWRAVAMATGAWSDIVAGHFGEDWTYHLLQVAMAVRRNWFFGSR